MRILIITSHLDDFEFGCGATVSRLKREGHDIRVCVFSASLTIEGNEGIKEEGVASVRGVYGLDFTVHDFLTMHFTEHYQDIRDIIFKLKQSFNPDVVYCKSPNSLHPDHRVIGEAVESIFLENTIYGMEGIRDGHNQRINKWVEVSSADLAVKQKALACYQSQKNKGYSDMQVIEGWARFRGAQVGKRYAEGFEVLKEVS